MQARKQPLIIANNFHPATIEALDAAYETTHLWTLDEAGKKAKLAELEGHCVAAASASWATAILVYMYKQYEILWRPIGQWQKKRETSMAQTTGSDFENKKKQLKKNDYQRAKMCHFILSA